MKIKTICICAVQVPFAVGGADVLAEQLDQQLKQRGFQSDIFRLPFQWWPKPAILKNALAWRLLELVDLDGKEIDLIIPTKFPSYIIKHPNKTVWLFHQHRELYDLYGSEFCNFDNTREDNELRDALIRMDKTALGECKKIFTISQNVANRLKKFSNFNGEPLYPPPKLKNKFYSEHYGDYILSVGRLDALKRLDRLITAFSYLPSHIKCLIAGKGPLQKELEETIEKYNLKDRVSLLGFVTEEELIKLYAGCFAVYFAPTDEDYGYITVESFLSRKPIITAPDSGGVIEFARNKENGIICSLEPEVLASKIEYLFNNKKLCQEMGEKGYDQVKNLSWDRVIEKLTSIQ